MGGVLGIFEEQAIVIPLPGEDSKAVRTFVSTTNKVLYNMRKLFCEKNTGDERSVAVAIFEYMLFKVKNSRVDVQECLSPQFLEENIKKDWEEATKNPLYIDASENMKKVMKDIFFDTANGKAIWNGQRWPKARRRTCAKKAPRSPTPCTQYAMPR